MSLPILTAVGDARWEAELTTGLSTGEHGVRVVRRCVDLADLLAAAAAGLARAVVLSADLRRLDREAVSRLEAAQVAVVGLTAAGDERSEHRLRQLGVHRVLAVEATSAEVAAAVLAAVEQRSTGVTEGSAAPEAGPPDPLAVASSSDRPMTDVISAGAGRVIAVWGPVGAPGRTTIATNLAAELAALGQTTLLIDADTYGAAVGQLLGVLDEAPGLAAACRLANTGALDAARLAEVGLTLRPNLRVLTGITRAERWPELRASSVEVVLRLARSIASVIVVDCGFCLEQDEELSYDTAAPRRNGATLATLAAADVVVGVAAGDPVGLARYVRALPDCASASAVTPLTVVNRLRRAAVGPGQPRRAVTAALRRFGGIDVTGVIPEDSAAVDAALASGRVLGECSPRSAARRAIGELAGLLTEAPVPGARSGTRTRRQRPLR